MWHSLCAEREIRGKDDKGILQITRLCVYYSELEHDIQSSSMQGFQLFSEKEKIPQPTGSTEWKKKGHNYSWGWRERVSPHRELSSAHLHLSLTWERGWLWSCLAQYVNSHSSNDYIGWCHSDGSLMPSSKNINPPFRPIWIKHDHNNFFKCPKVLISCDSLYNFYVKITWSFLPMWVKICHLHKDFQDERTRKKSKTKQCWLVTVYFSVSTLPLFLPHFYQHSTSGSCECVIISSVSSSSVASFLCVKSVKNQFTMILLWWHCTRGTFTLAKVSGL